MCISSALRSCRWFLSYDFQLADTCTYLQWFFSCLWTLFLISKKRNAECHEADVTVALCSMLYSYSGRGWGYTQDAAMVPLRNTVRVNLFCMWADESWQTLYPCKKKKGTAASLFTFVTRWAWVTHHFKRVGGECGLKEAPNDIRWVRLLFSKHNVKNQIVLAVTC